jgi:DNA-3-methyladenine glycosylase I
MKEKIRCNWCLKESIYIKYHDEEWGRPVHDDQKLFEFLVLESFQAGLSWLTVLKKRENFRKAFSNFDVKKISKYNQKKIDVLLKDEGIIRNRLKIEATINNAKCFLLIQQEFCSFDSYVWSFVNYKPIVNNIRSIKEIPGTSVISDRMSKDMGLRGFKFRGTTICYAFMQAVGMIDDHINDCWKKSKKK